MQASRESFFSNTAPRTRDVLLPNSNTVTVRELTTAEVLDFSALQKVDQKRATALLMLKATLDGSGNQLFADDDSEKLIALPYALSSVLVDAILDLSGLKESAEKKLSASVNDDSK